MLTNASILIHQELTGNTSITSLLDDAANGVFPMLADEDAGDKFVTYQIEMQPAQSKDDVKNIVSKIYCWANTYNESIEIADAVLQSLKESSTQYKLRTAQPKLSEGPQIVTEIIVEILK